MSMGSHICMTIPKTARQHWAFKTFLEKIGGEIKEKRGGGALDFRSENARFTGSGGEAEHAWLVTSCLAAQRQWDPADLATAGEDSAGD